MSKENKERKILIAILALAAIFDLAVFFNCLLRNNIISIGDLGIWVGSVGSIAAFFGIIYQVYKQGEDLEKQIHNQNKQMHRPFVKAQFHQPTTAQYFINEHKIEEVKATKYLELFNIGIGIGLDTILIKYSENYSKDISSKYILTPVISSMAPKEDTNCVQ